MFKLVFIQEYGQAHQQEFLQLEEEFVRLEREHPQMPQGRRFLPYASGEPSNTLIWECWFETMEELAAARRLLDTDEVHETLYRRQLPFFVRSRTEIYRSFP